MSFKKEESTGWAERRSATEVFLPENVALTILFGRHALKSDLGDYGEFRHLMRSSHIFIPEALGWDDVSRESLRLISTGNARIYQHYKESDPEQYRGHHEAVFDALYGSHVKVQMVDVEQGNPITKSLDQYHIVRGHIPLVKSTYQKSMDAVEALIKPEAVLQKQREDYILAQLGPKLREIIDPNPKLRAMREVRVLMLLGSEHVRIFDILEKSIEPEPTRLPSVSKRVFLPTEEYPEVLLRNLLKGKAMPVEKSRLLAEILIKSIVQGMMEQAHRQPDVTLASSIVRSLSDKELRAVYDSIDVGMNRLYNTPIVQKIKQLLG